MGLQIYLLNKSSDVFVWYCPDYVYVSICKYTANTYTQFHSLKPCGVWDRHVFEMMDVFVLRIAAKQSDVVIVDSFGHYGIWVGSRLQLCTLQGTDRYPAWASLENHRLKHTLGGDMLVPKRVTVIDVTAE